MYIWNWGTYF